MSFISAVNDDVILRLSSETNAHGEIYSGTAYPIEIKYSEIFGSLYTGTYEEHPSTCNVWNAILRLSSTTNAHSEVLYKDNYNIFVCYGDLIGNARYVPNGNCDVANGEKCVVTLSSETNAHLAKCGITGSYPNKICCKSPSAGGGENPPPCEEGETLCNDGTTEYCSSTGCGEDIVCNNDNNCDSGEGCDCSDCEGKQDSCKSGLICDSNTKTCEQVIITQTCEEYTNQTNCWSGWPYQNCTWTPAVNINTGDLILTQAQGGHCCEDGQIYDAILGCNPTDTTFCTIPLINPPNQYSTLYSSNGPINLAKTDYCVQVSKGVNTGLWADIITY